MILVDTSVWVQNLRTGDARLRDLLRDEAVLGHSFVIGDLACGTMRNRTEILSLPGSLPPAHVAEHHEVLDFVESAHLHGQGLGWIDIHLLASARLTRSPLWTSDRALARAAAALRLSA